MHVPQHSVHVSVCVCVCVDDALDAQQLLLLLVPLLPSLQLRSCCIWLSLGIVSVVLSVQMEIP